LKFAKSREYSLIILDQEIPHNGNQKSLQGHEICTLLRKNGFKNLIIMRTTECTRGKIDLYFHAGADILLPKQMHPRVLRCFMKSLPQLVRERTDDKVNLFLRGMQSGFITLWKPELALLSPPAKRTRKLKKVLHNLNKQRKFNPALPSCDRLKRFRHIFLRSQKIKEFPRRTLTTSRSFPQSYLRYC